MIYQKDHLIIFYIFIFVADVNSLITIRMSFALFFGLRYFYFIFTCFTAQIITL